MKVKIGKFTGGVMDRDGKKVLTIKNPEMWGKFLSNFNEEDILDIRVTRWKENRSEKQNGYYWAVVVKMISEHTGFDMDETHEVLKRKFLGYIKEYKGERFWFVKSTTALKTDEFSEYVENCRRFAATDLQVVIPDPYGDNYYF